jgi:hypothetical protein
MVISEARFAERAKLVRDAFKSIPSEDLRPLIQIVKEEIKFVNRLNESRVSDAFRLNDLVSFTAKHRVWRGRIIRRNLKTATVLTAEGKTWTVSWSYLKKEADNG